MLGRICIVAGAIPNFMKIAPLITQFENENINYQLIHTGQHYDYNMSKIFLLGFVYFQIKRILKIINYIKLS